MSKKERTGYFGFDRSSEFLKYDYEFLINYITGQLIVAIGNGQFDLKFYNSISMLCGWALYNPNLWGNQFPSTHPSMLLKWNDFKDSQKGNLLAMLGAGSLKQGVYNMASYTTAWAIHNDKGV